MTSNPNDPFDSSTSDEGNYLNDPSSGTNLEFDFESQSSQKARSSTASKAPTTFPDLNKKRAVAVPTEIREKKSASNFQTNPSRIPSNSKPNLDEKSMSPTPSSTYQTDPKTMNNPVFSQFQQNIKRQSREQKAVGSLLSSVGIVLTGSILLVAILAAYGGWMLSRQIRTQNATILQLDAKLTEENQKLWTNLKETMAVTENLTAQTQAQKQQIVWLQNRLEEIHNQNKKDLAATRTSLQKMEIRLYNLERGEVQRR